MVDTPHSANGQEQSAPEIQTASPQMPKASALVPGLYIVATPIGNLRDITLRALDVLRGAEMILAEDTRQSRKLLDAYGITTPLSAYHDHNAAKRVPALIERLKDGATLALVSDAGTPLVSDPGFKLARACAEADITVVPIPGASAVLAGLVASALPSDSFTFAGFLPPKSGARKTELAKFAALSGTVIFFESAGRIAATLSDAREILGERDAAIARELTKTYEQTRRGSLSALIDSVANDPPRGEIVLLIGPSASGDLWTQADVQAALIDALPEMGVKRASAHISELSGWAKRDVYQMALSLK